MNNEKLIKDLKDRVEELEFEIDEISIEYDDLYEKYEEEADLRRIISRKEAELSDYCKTLEQILENNGIDINQAIQELEDQEEN